MIIFLLILIIPYNNLIAWAYYKEPIFFACIGKQKAVKNILFTIFNELYTKAMFICTVFVIIHFKYNLTFKYTYLILLFAIINLILSIIVSRKVLLSFSTTLYYTKGVILERFTKITR